MRQSALEEDEFETHRLEYPPLQIRAYTLRARRGIRGGKGIHAAELSERGDALEAAGLRSRRCRRRNRIVDFGNDEVLVKASEVGRGAARGAEVRQDQLRTAHDPRRAHCPHPRVLRRGRGPPSRRTAAVAPASCFARGRSGRTRPGGSGGLLSGNRVAGCPAHSFFEGIAHGALRRLRLEVPLDLEERLPLLW